MLALKKKREAEAKAKAEAEAAAATGAASPAAGPSSPPAAAASEESSASNTNKVSLLGIGGKKKKSDGAGANGTNGTKKRTPGEIRIQKGQFSCVLQFLCREFVYFCDLVERLSRCSFVILLLRVCFPGKRFLY